MQANKMFPTYVFCKVQRDRVPQVVEELRKYSEIEFNAQVTGRYDIVMRIKTSNPEQLYNTINKIRSIHGVNATNTFTANDGFVNGQKLDAQGVWGFSLLSINKPIPEVIQKLKSLPAIYDAWSIPGQFDIIMSYKAQNYEQLMKTTVEQLAHTDGILRSETLFAYQPNVKA
ncbi:MAG TPA: Lrp/AsnC ligand binding domain-containing protein [Candidatus Bathyarchaeia archaeon]|nr:Lrp/AsnC ligand binding domain-containing protein [Candidatus Bathyarchaeia archaeon]